MLIIKKQGNNGTVPVFSLLFRQTRDASAPRERKRSRFGNRRSRREEIFPDMKIEYFLN